MSNQYLELVTKFPPRVIRTEERLRNTQEVVDALLDKFDELTEDEQDYLHLLGTLIHEYEKGLNLFPDT